MDMISIKEAIKNAKNIRMENDHSVDYDEFLNSLKEYDEEVQKAFIEAEADVDKEIKMNKILTGVHGLSIAALTTGAIYISKRDDVSDNMKYLTGGIATIFTVANACSLVHDIKNIKLLKEEKFCLNHNCDIDAIIAAKK